MILMVFRCPQGGGGAGPSVTTCRETSTRVRYTDKFTFASVSVSDAIGADLTA